MIYCKNHSTLKNRGEVLYFQVHKKSSLVNVYTGTPGKPHKSSLGRSVRPTPTRSPPTWRLLPCWLAPVITDSFHLFLTVMEMEGTFLDLASFVLPYACGFIVLWRVAVVYSFHCHVIFHCMTILQFTQPVDGCLGRFQLLLVLCIKLCGTILKEQGGAVRRCEER